MNRTPQKKQTELLTECHFSREGQKKSLTLPLNNDLSNSETYKSLIQLDTYLKVICKTLLEVPLGYIKKFSS